MHFFCGFKFAELELQTCLVTLEVMPLNISRVSIYQDQEFLFSTDGMSKKL